MSYFTKKTIRGREYALDHLDPFKFSVQTIDRARVVLVVFRCHCFTETLKAEHTPDFRYSHANETRAFSFERYELSFLLPDTIKTLGNRSVYSTKVANYFILRGDPLPQFKGPFLIFFNVTKAKRVGLDAIMTVESAYMKPNMVDRAAPVKFATLIEKTALGQKVPTGPAQTIKRK